MGLCLSFSFQQLISFLVHPDTVNQGDILRHLFPYTSTCQGPDSDSKQLCRIRCICMYCTSHFRGWQICWDIIRIYTERTIRCTFPFFVNAGPRVYSFYVGKQYKKLTKDSYYITISFVYSVFSLKFCSNISASLFGWAYGRWIQFIMSFVTVIKDKWVRCKNQGRRFILGQDKSNFWDLLILFFFLILYVMYIWEKLEYVRDCCSHIKINRIQDIKI